MKAAATIAEGRLGIVEVPPAPLLPGQVRVAVRYCGICGSDIHWRTHFPAGTIMGHEVVGQIAELGEGVTGWSMGDRVAILPADPCGTCNACLKGWTNICSSRRFGIGGPRAAGGYAESVIVFASMLFALPDRLEDRAAALVEPLTVGLHGVNRSGALPDASVVVIGAGTIGLLTTLALRARGFERILVIEPNAARRMNLAALGIATIDSRNSDAHIETALGGQPQFIFECAGYPQAIIDAVRMIAPRGRIICLSAPSAPVLLPQWEIMAKEAEIGSAIFYTKEEFEEAIAMLATNAVPASAVPLTIVALDEAPQALEELLLPDTPHMKILIKP